MKEKTKELLAYLVKNHPDVSITSLMKLSYLTDLVSVKKTGNPISGFQYRRYKYGPFDDEIYKFLQDLKKTQAIKENVAFTQMGDDYIVYRFNDNIEFQPRKLNSAEMEIADEVLEALKGLGAKALVELAYKTKPMKKIGAKRDNEKGLNLVLDLSAS